MKLLLTKGMFNVDNDVEIIADDMQTEKAVLEHIYCWKNNLDNQQKYHICEYDRYIFDNKNNMIAIDFGDYANFLLIDDIQLGDTTKFLNI